MVKYRLDWTSRGHRFKFICSCQNNELILIILIVCFWSKVSCGVFYNIHRLRELKRFSCRPKMRFKCGTFLHIFKRLRKGFDFGILFLHRPCRRLIFIVFGIVSFFLVLWKVYLEQTYSNFFNAFQRYYECTLLSKH